MEVAVAEPEFSTPKKRRIERLRKDAEVGCALAAAVKSELNAKPTPAKKRILNGLVAVAAQSSPDCKQTLATFKLKARAVEQNWAARSTVSKSTTKRLQRG